MIYTAILIFFILVLLASIKLELSIKSSNDTIKIVVKIGFIYFVVPHQKIIRDILDKQMKKPLIEQRSDFFDLVNKRGLFASICKHSSLNELYIGRFKDEELYLSPLANGLYYIISNQIKGVASNLFKRIDHSVINLIYDPKYENLDYYVELKTDVISMVSAFVEAKMKGDLI